MLFTAGNRDRDTNIPLLSNSGRMNLFAFQDNRGGISLLFITLLILPQFVETAYPCELNTITCNRAVSHDSQASAPLEWHKRTIQAAL
jgi:hypothetical protein